jgi:hypothetical protein
MCQSRSPGAPSWAVWLLGVHSLTHSLPTRQIARESTQSASPIVMPNLVLPHTTPGRTHIGSWLYCFHGWSLHELFSNSRGLTAKSETAGWFLRNPGASLQNYRELLISELFSRRKPVDQVHKSMNIPWTGDPSSPELGLRPLWCSRAPAKGRRRFTAGPNPEPGQNSKEFFLNFNLFLEFGRTFEICTWRFRRDFDMRIFPKIF